MPAVSSPAKVLVSGANGFLAVYIIKDLLERGYTIRGTVRSESKNAYLLNLFKKEAQDGKFELVVVPDITAPGAFDEAVKGVDAIEHTASPYHYKADDPSEIIDPAVKGTIGILESVLKHAGPQLKRVVVTSSISAIMSPESNGVLTEKNWNDSSITQVRELGRAADQGAKYRASKSLAEKVAWEFVEKNKSKIAWDLTTLCPPFVYGPILHDVRSPEELNSSMALFYEAIFTKRKTLGELAQIQSGWVDARDVSLGHVRALEVPAAGGERFILSGGEAIWQDWFDVLNELDIPDFNVPVGTPGAGKAFKYKQTFDNSKAKEVLGIKFHEKPETALDIVNDLRAKGW
ncbi:hypothetical protein EW145_g3174 [Phellinidium pouzarii]|uniref:NAD-dependent epimerase/dehydratase domain-containing protein n=1 Tax=Phellinidium pouzarii TaxID=167371 RepID=A0A4S4L896_9AGAM|nr:hypothetical protein EW145_g3174 [Phellinidium pouzarii]